MTKWLKERKKEKRRPKKERTRVSQYTRTQSHNCNLKAMEMRTYLSTR